MSEQVLITIIYVIGAIGLVTTIAGSLLWYQSRNKSGKWELDRATANLQAKRLEYEWKREQAALPNIVGKEP